MYLDVFGELLQILFFLDIIFAIIIVFFERRTPAVTWAWLIVVLLLPYIGFLLYLWIGLEGRKHQAFIRKSKQDENLFIDYINMDINRETLILQQGERISRVNILGIPGSEYLNDLVYLNCISGHGAISDNNIIDIFHNGNTKFDTLIEDIENAKNFIHLEYYIVRNDNLSKRLIAALAKKADEGVEVKFLIDGMGCAYTSKKIFKPMIDAGGQLGIFIPPHFIRINYRNHRKICVIDGSIGYVGGMNIGDEYLGLVKKFGHWRDCHIKIMGDAVKDLQLRFIVDWNYCAAEKIALNARYFPKQPAIEGINAQIVSSGPDTAKPNIHYSYLKMITEAEKSIYIQTPYFVPDDSILEMLRIAALSGIDVRIMIPANPDHPFVYWAALSYLGELLDAGVKCYQYDNGFVHSKLMVVDSLAASVGTANLDIRSFKLNFEVNAFIYDRQAAVKLEKQFLIDIKDCTVIDSKFYANRSAMARLKESISRLIAPLL